MAITLIVTRSYDESFQETGNEIALEDWLKLVERDPLLRLQGAPSTATNPRTKQVISIGSAPGQAELTVDGRYVPFLRYRGGELVMDYSEDLEDGNNPVRREVAEVARRFGAIITHDAGDEILKW